MLELLGKRKRCEDDEMPKRYKRTDEEKTKIREGLNRYYLTAPKDKHQKIMTVRSGKRVGRYENIINLVEIYDSISEASRRTGIAKSNIQHALSGRSARAGGFYWRFIANKELKDQPLQ